MIFCNLKTVCDLNEVLAKICSKRNPKTAGVLSLLESPPGLPSANKHVLDGNWTRCVSDRLIAGTWSSRLGVSGPGLGQAGWRRRRQCRECQGCHVVLEVSEGEVLPVGITVTCEYCI